RDPHIEQRKNQVLSAERFLAIQKGLELRAAMYARHRTRRHNGNEKYRLGDGSLDFVFPFGTVRNGHGILEQLEITPELQAQFIENLRPEARQRALRMLIVSTRVAEKSCQIGE